MGPGGGASIYIYIFIDILDIERNHAVAFVGAPNHESWVVPAGVSSALAVLGGEIPSRIDSSTIWAGGGNCGRINLFACEGFF